MITPIQSISAQMKPVGQMNSHVVVSKGAPYYDSSTSTTVIHTSSAPIVHSDGLETPMIVNKLGDSVITP